MANLPIASAAALTGAQTASGDLFPLLDVSAAAGSQGSKITRDELGDAMTRTAALIAALAAKLDKAGGTMTGVLSLAEGTNAAPSVNFGDAGTGFYKYATNNIGVTCNGTMRWYWNQDGSLYNNGAALIMNSSYAVMPTLYLRTNGLCLLMGASDDVRIERAAAASLQLGSNHATTPTAQTIKAHNVTTGTGAALILCGGTGSVAGGSVKLAAPSTTGAGVTAVEVGPGGLLGFFGAGPQTQPSTGGSSASFVENTGTALNENSTFDNYTISQVVAALRSLGLLG